MNSILQGVLLIIVGILLIIYRKRNSSPSPDAGASDFNQTIAIIGIFILAITILSGWNSPF